ncbi:MAG: methyltransferase domain-containing protein [Chlamydiota bacterium]
MNILILCIFVLATATPFCEPKSSYFEFNETQVKSYNEKPSLPQDAVVKIIESGFFLDAHRILDVGCGDGKLTACFASHLPQAEVVGSDISQSMIDFASNHYTSHNLNFIVKNAENLNFQEPFDAIISFNCLHWVKNQKRAIEQISHSLKPNGKIFLIATPDSSNNDFKKICRKIILSWKWMFHFLGFQSTHSFHKEKEYREFLIDSGFLIDKIETKQTELIFKNREELEPFLKAILTPLQHLDPLHHSAFLTDFYRGLSKAGRIYRDGSIHIFFDQIELQAHKKP